jgi:hypothetical protein
MAEYFLIDTRTNTIINACMTSRPGGPGMEGLDSPEHYRWDPNPPLSMLEAYRYWNERP